MKYNKRLSLILPLMCFSLIACNGSLIQYNTFEYKDKNGITYRLFHDGDSKHAELIDIPDNLDEIIVPDEMFGLPVTRVNSFYSEKLTKVRRLVLGKNVDYFGGAYNKGGYGYGSYSLLEFEGDTAWPNLEIFSCDESKINAIPDTCFAKSPKLKEIHLNEGLKEIGAGAFFECLNLENFTFPNSVESIKISAFQGCKKLNDNLRLSDNIKTLDPAFDDTSIIAHYGVEEGEKVLLTNSGKKCLISYEITSKTGDLIIDYPVIGSWALYIRHEGYSYYYDYSYNSIAFTAKALPGYVFYYDPDDYSRRSLPTDYLYLENIEYLSSSSLNFVDPKNIVIGGNLQTIEDYAFDIYENLETISLTNPNCEKYIAYDNVLYETSEEGYHIALFPYKPLNNTITLHEKTIDFGNQIRTYRKNTFDKIGFSDFTLHHLFSRNEEEQREDEEEHYYYDFLSEFKNKMCAKEYFITDESNDFSIAGGGICRNGDLLMGPKLIDANYTVDSSVTRIKKDAFDNISGTTTSGTTTFKVSRSVKEIEKYAIESTYEPIAIYIPKEVTKIGGQIIRRDSYHNNNVTFYVEASSMPSGWSANCFNNGEYGQHNVYWGQTFDY